MVFQFRVIDMSCLVTSGFLLEVAAKASVRFLRSGSQGREVPKNICHLIVEIVFSPFLKDWSPFAFAMTRASSPTSSGQYRHIGEFAEIAHSVFFIQVHLFLCFF